MHFFFALLNAAAVTSVVRRIRSASVTESASVTDRQLPPSAAAMSGAALAVGAAAGAAVGVGISDLLCPRNQSSDDDTTTSRVTAIAIAAACAATGALLANALSASAPPTPPTTATATPVPEALRDALPDALPDAPNVTLPPRAPLFPFARPPLADVTFAIGATPIVRLDPTKLGFPRASSRAEIFAKLEFQNPGGSVKDRIAVAMIDDAEARGLIAPGRSTLVEATSGNTGIAVAMVGAARGYAVVVAMPRLQAMLERYMLIRSFGGIVLLSDPETKSQGFLDLAERYAKEHPEAYLLRQFTNPANIQAHYETTGPEIWEQMGGDVDIVVMGAGTGGTAVGCGRYLKEVSAERADPCRVVVVEPAESRVLQGEKHRVHSITGIGTGLRVPMMTALDDEAPWESGPSDRNYFLFIM